MMRWTMPAALLMLAACGGGQDEETGPEASSDIGPLQKAERPAPVETPAADAEAEAPAKADPGDAADGKTIPPAIRGSWALKAADCRSEEHTSELQSLMRISYAVFCLNKKTINKIFNKEHELRSSQQL